LLMFTLACDGGEPAACFAAGEVLTGDPSRAPERRRLLERSCRAGYVKGCEALGRPD